LINREDPRGVRPELEDRIRNVVAALVAATEIEEISGPPGWRLHRLRHDRTGTWSIRVSGNWRITFEVVDDEIWNLNLEDYH